MIRRVISRITVVTTQIKGFVTPLMSTHETSQQLSVVYYGGLGCRV